MAGQFDLSEMVDVVEVSYRVIQAKQQKYACRCGDCVETAPGPERAIKGGRYSLAFAVKVGTESRVLLEHMKTWLWSQAPLKTLWIGKAAAYAIGDWDRLTRFLDPRIPLDKNATERGVRGPVVGRRNHYGSKSGRGTEVASIVYSLVEAAKLHGIDPAAYMAEAARLAPLGEVLMPWDFAD